jgi:hypothetical protein
MTAVKRRLGSRRKPITLGVTLALMAAALVLVIPAVASHPEVSLAGSNFEIDTDANLKVDDAAPSIDWASVAETRKADIAPGPTDDSFGQGTKEDTAVPSVVDGSIPPNKSDLLNFGVHLETNAAGRFLNLFWHRVQEPSGTTNMDFEFNQSSTLSGNGVTPVRTAGDLLIQYDLSQGGTNPQLFLSRWVTTGPGSLCQANNSTPCWGARINLSAAGDAAGSINTSSIPAAEADGLGDISSRTFGEAQLDFDALTGGSGQCVSFGSAYLKSRSSDSFTAALKDFIAPLQLNLNQCATVIIRKQTVPDEDPNTTSFGYTKSFPTQPSTPNTFTLTDDGVQSYNGTVLPGTGYTVVEDVIPANWQFTSLDCSASSGVTPTIVGATVTFAIDASTDILDCTYTNSRRLGAIEITKTRKHAADGAGNHPHAGVNFTITGGSLPPGGTVVTTDANGVACLDGLVFGDYVVTESVPAGYVSDDAVKEATVNANSDCGDGNEAAVSFHNRPLTNVTLSVDSQVPGGTASHIVCNGQEADTGAGGDGSLTLSDLPPTAPSVTVTCTVVVDP